jgi:hypothetical protein
MKPTATLWVIGSYHNIFRVGSALQDQQGAGTELEVVGRVGEDQVDARRRQPVEGGEAILELRGLRHLHPRLALGLPPGDEADRDPLGDRVVPPAPSWRL